VAVVEHRGTRQPVCRKPATAPAFRPRIRPRRLRNGRNRRQSCRRALPTRTCGYSSRSSSMSDVEHSGAAGPISHCAARPTARLL